MNIMRFFKRKGKSDVIVNSDVAFHTPVYKEVEEIKDKYPTPDFSELSFEEDIADYPMNTLSDESKRKIIEIIKADTLARIELEQQRVHEEVNKDL